MADKLQFDLVSPEARVFSGEVDMVVVPGSEGDFGVFARPRALHVDHPHRLPSRSMLTAKLPAPSSMAASPK